MNGATGKLWHLVIFRLAPEVPAERVQEIRSLFRSGVGQCDGLEWVRAASNNSRSRRAAGWTEAVVMQFRDRAARDAYLDHPHHRRIEDAVGDTYYTDAVVFDMDVDEAAPVVAAAATPTTPPTMADQPTPATGPGSGAG